jgi:hypothetical protein
MRAAGQRAVCAGCAVLAGWLAGLGGATASADVGISIRPVGSLAFAWKGAQGRGCASEGLCNVTGSLVVRVGNSSSGSTGTPPIELSDDSVVAREQESSPSGTVESACADPESVDFELRVIRSAGGGVRARSESGSLGWPSAGRCAGPTAADLASLVLPARSLGTHGYDLSGSVAFGAGPFDVTVTSHIRALIERDHFGIGVGGVSSGHAPKLHRRLQEDAEVDYRVVDVSGALDASFSGVEDPACEPLGTCGNTGSLTDSLSAAHQRLAFFGSRTISHRVGERTALSDLRAGRLNVFDTSFGLQLRERVTGTLHWADGSTCADTVTGPAAPVQSHVTARADVFQFAPHAEYFFPGADPLRSRCPGPSGSEIGAGHALAAGSVPLHDLGAARLTLRLGGSGTFSAAEYRGAHSGAIVLTLARSRMSGRTSTVRLAAGGV